MITVLAGENTYQVTQALDALRASFSGEVERFDGEKLEYARLVDAVAGGTLFSSERLIVVRQLSDNTAVWSVLPDLLARVSDDVHLVLVESTLDKRTKTYKVLQKMASVQEYKPWTERDIGLAEDWVSVAAKEMNIAISHGLVRQLVARVGVDQWALRGALEKLSVFDDMTAELLADSIEATPSENVFNLFEAALRGHADVVARMIKTLEVTEDPYRLFGLLSGQAFQLAALAVTDKPSAEVARDLGAHPFAVSKLATHAKQRGPRGAQAIIRAFEEADAAMKTSAADPWLLIERALAKSA